MKESVTLPGDRMSATVSRFQAGLEGVTLTSHGSRLLGGFYQAAGDTPHPTAILLHGLPGIEKHLDIAYRLRDLGWNCLYFHFRGSWGSHGAFSLAGLVDDTRAAVDWIAQQESVDAARIALIAASTGSHPAITLGASDQRVRAIVGVSPLIEPRAFQFPRQMADEFAEMLNGVSGQDLLNQWDQLDSLQESIRGFAPREMLLIGAGKDSVFPPAQYAAAINALPHIGFIEHSESDHGFSEQRPWLVHSVTQWLVAKLPQQ